MTGHEAKQPPTDFYVLGGPMKRDAESYVARQADSDLYAYLSKREYCHVLTSRQMGKTSLVVQTAARLRHEGLAVSYLDVSSNGKNLTAKQWYHGLLNQIAQDLDLEDELEEFWLSKEQQVYGSPDDSREDRFGPHQLWERAIQEVVLSRCPGQIVVFVDEVDFVLSLPFSTDEFLAGIRAFYSRRAFDPELERLTFCLLGVVSPTDLIRDARTTPFNIGRRIELNDFNEEEVAPLARGLGRAEDETKQLMKRVLYWTAGQPYLTQRLCREVAEDPAIKSARDVDRVCERSFFSARAQRQDLNLTYVSRPFVKKENIKEADRASFLSDEERAALLTLYAQIRNYKGVWDDGGYQRVVLSLRRAYGWARGQKKVIAGDANPLVSTLQISGITRAVDGHLFVRNRIYHRVFDQEWVNVNMPGAERRRQQAAFRGGLIRATAYAAVVVLMFGALTTYAFRMKREADIQKQIAVDERSVAESLRLSAEEERGRADQNAHEAERQKLLAVQQQKIAEVQRRRAEGQKHLADQKTGEAVKALAEANYHRSVAERETAIARQQKLEAIAARTEADSAKIAAELRRKEADKEKDTNRHLAYTAHLNLAHQELSNNNRVRAQELLEIHRTEGDLRGFEWYHLLELCHPEWDTLQNRSGGVTAIAFSPDGALATGDNNGTVALWDLAAGSEPAIIKSGAPNVLSIAFSSDGKMLAIGSDENTVLLFDIEKHGEPIILAGHSGAVRSVAFNPKSRVLATGSDDNTVRLWDTNAHTLMATLSGHNLPVYSVAFSSRGLLATGSLDRTVKIWDPATYQESTTFETSGLVYSVAFSPDGAQLAAGGPAGVVKLWDTETHEPLPDLAGNSVVLSVAFSPDGKLLACGGLDNSLKLWDMTTREEVAAIREHKRSVRSVAFSPNGGILATGSLDQTIKLWDTAKELRRGNLNGYVSAAFSQDSKRLATGSDDGTVRLWTLSTRQKPLLLTGHSASVLSVAFSMDGKRLATGSRDKTVRLWDAKTGEELATFAGHTSDVVSVAFSPDGDVIASGSLDNTAKLWDTNKREALTTLTSHTGSVFSIAFSSTGRLATGSTDKTIKLWDPATWQEITTFDGGSPIFSVTFSPNGSMLAAGGVDKTVRLWDITRKDPFRLEGHSASVTTVDFSPDGRTLATGCVDGTVKLWDTATLEELLTFRGNSSGVRFAKFSGDSKTLAIGTSDGKIALRYGSAPPKKAGAGVRAEAPTGSN